MNRFTGMHLSKLQIPNVGEGLQKKKNNIQRGKIPNEQCNFQVIVHIQPILHTHTAVFPTDAVKQWELRGRALGGG